MSHENNDTVSDQLHETALVLANAAELTSAVIKRVAGNDISTAINGSSATREMIQNLMLRDMTKTLRQAAAK